jgi:hypothetical protein
VFTTFGETPDTDASATEIATFYAAHRTEQLTAGTTWALALLPLVVFMGRLHAVLRRAEGGDGTVTNVFLLGAVAFLVAPIIWVGGVLGVAFRAGETDPAVSQYNADLFILPVSASAPVWAGMFFAIALITLRLGRDGLPRWLGRFAVFTGVCQFFYLGTPYQPSGIWWSSNQGILVAYLAYGSQLAWITSTSVYWLRSARRAAADAPAALEDAGA